MARVGNPQFAAHPLHLREKGYALSKQGKSYVQIAALLSIPLNTIKRWGSVGKWKDRMRLEMKINPGMARSMNPDDPSILDTTNPEVEAKAHDMTLQEKQEEYQEQMAIQALRLPAMLRTMSDADVLKHAEKISKADNTNRKALKLEESKPNVVVNVGLLAGALPARPALEDAEEVPALPKGDVVDAELVEATIP